MRRISLAGPSPEARIQLQFARHIRLLAWALPNMAAPFWRCYVPLEPGGLVLWQGEEIPLVPGTWMLIPPGTAASTRLTQSFCKVFCHFLYRPPGHTAVPGIYTGGLSAKEKRLVRQEARHAASPARDDLGLTHLMLHLALGGLVAMPREAFAPRPMLAPQVERAMALLDARLAAPPSNADLAAAVGLHPNSLVRLFKRQTGVTPQAHGRRVRLEHACSLLVDSSMSVEQIAEACGFWDRNHFTRAFTRHWGRPPGEFRRQH